RRNHPKWGGSHARREAALGAISVRDVGDLNMTLDDRAPGIGIVTRADDPFTRVREIASPGDHRPKLIHEVNLPNSRRFDRAAAYTQGNASVGAPRKRVGTGC